MLVEICLFMFNTAQLRFYHCPLKLNHCTNGQGYPLILGPLCSPSPTVALAQPTVPLLGVQLHYVHTAHSIIVITSSFDSCFVKSELT